LVENGTQVPGKHDRTNRAAAGTTMTLAVTAGNPTQITDLGAGFNISKEGDGTVVFAGANSYTGTTTVDDGILRIQNALSLSPNRVTVNNTSTGAGTRVATFSRIELM